MKRKNKASLFHKFTLSNGKEEILRNPKGLNLPFFLGIYLCLQDEN